MASALPAVVDALVTLSRAALPDVTVYDGLGVSGEPGDFLMVGVEDPDIEGAAFSADINQVRVSMGERHETGSVTCCALSWDGAGDQQAARNAAFATVAAVENIVRTAAPTLDVAAVLKTEFGERLTVSQAQGAEGADCMVIFSVAYLAQV